MNLAVAGGDDGCRGVHERRERKERVERGGYGEVLLASKVVRPSQIAFMPSWNIMEGVVILHETIH
jgi:hypothetical protein